MLVARSIPTTDGGRVVIDEVWPRRREVELADGVATWIPALDDLIATKRIGSRPKDLEDIRLLKLLKKAGT